MALNYLALFTALIISGVAAFYSIVGLTAIFAAAFWPIVVMGTVLELGKIVASVWLKRYWDDVGWQLRSYLTFAVAVLMLITSMGIFGFLSRAHLEQGVPTSEVSARLEILDSEISVQRDNITQARASLAQLDEQVNQRLSRGTSEQGAERAVAIRRQQARERAQLQQEIAQAQQRISNLSQERAPIATELRKVESEVGPIKYVAALIYGDNPEANLLERAVRWMIIIIVLVFDPLAIALILAANSGFRWERERQAAQKSTTTHVDVTPLDPPKERTPAANAEVDVEPSLDEQHEDFRLHVAHEAAEPVPAYLTRPFVHFPHLSPIVAPPLEPEHTVDESEPLREELAQLTRASQELAVAYQQELDRTDSLAEALVEAQEKLAHFEKQAEEFAAIDRELAQSQTLIKQLEQQILEWKQKEAMLLEQLAMSKINALARAQQTETQEIDTARTEPEQTTNFNKEYIKHLIGLLEKGEIELGQLSEAEQYQIKKLL
jgi:hypothetical protein